MGTASVVNRDELLLDANGFGRSAGIFPLSAAPTNTVRMKLAFRWGRSGLTASVNENSPSLTWNPYRCCGLNFLNEIPADSDDEIPTATSADIGFDKFFGIAETFYQGGSGIYPSALIGHELRYNSQTAGTDTIHLTGPIQENATYSDRFYLGVPYSVQPFRFVTASGGWAGSRRWFSEPCDGTEATWVQTLDIWGSSIDKSVYCRMKGNNEGLSEGSFLDAIDNDAFGGPSNYGHDSNNAEGGALQIHGDVTSNFRNSDGTMNFPRYFVCRNGSKDVDLKVERIEYEHLSVYP